jgi:hypothetical protein
MIARITKIFRQGKEFWCEARAEEQMLFRFRAPAGEKLSVGDAISYDRRFLGQEAAFQVFKPSGSAVINVRKADVKDLRDRRVIADLVFKRSGTRIVLRATGEPEIMGLQPGASGSGAALFDSVDGLAAYMRSHHDWLESSWDSAGPLELREALLKWIKTKAIPELRAAEKKSIRKKT